MQREYSIFRGRSLSLSLIHSITASVGHNQLLFISYILFLNTFSGLYQHSLNTLLNTLTCHVFNIFVKLSLQFLQRLLTLSNLNLYRLTVMQFHKKKITCKHLCSAHPCCLVGLKCLGFCLIKMIRGAIFFDDSPYANLPNFFQSI